MKKNKGGFEDLIQKACNVYTEKEKKTKSKDIKESSKSKKNK